MADYWARREKIFQSLRSLPPQAKGLAQAWANRNGPVVPPSNQLSLVLYPTYSYRVTEKVDAITYSVTARGWLFKEGDSKSRRTKFLIGTAERLVGGGSDDDAPVNYEKMDQQLIEIMENDTDSESINSRYSDSTGGSARSNASDGGPVGTMAESLLGSRVKLLFRKGIANQTVELEVKSKEGDAQQFLVQTDESGRFEQTLRLSFNPHTILSYYDEDYDGPIAVVEPYHMQSAGVSVISDIDDTVRLTGVNKGHRETLRNVFNRSFDQVKLPGVADWYRRMAAAGANFHYVSNSPWQLYELVNGFLRHHEFPEGSIHLKYYQGLFDGLFEPVASRKRATLERLLSDFPERHFILIGDSGELDLEAYTLLAQKFPDQILAIFIRDITIPESQPLSILDHIQSPTIESPSVSTVSEDMDLIDLSDGPKKKPPPIPPRPVNLHVKHEKTEIPENMSHEVTPQWKELHKALLANERNLGAAGGVGGAMFAVKNAALSSAAVARDTVSRSAAKYAGRNGTSKSSGDDTPPLPPRPGGSVSSRRSRSPLPTFVSSSQDYSEYERTAEDKQIDAWKTRVDIARRALPEGVQLRMWRNPEDVEAEALRLVKAAEEDSLL